MSGFRNYHHESKICLMRTTTVPSVSRCSTELYLSSLATNLNLVAMILSLCYHVLH